jgi:hypothetical protein
MEKIFGSELASVIKKQILSQRINTPCCKRSFITGAELFAKNRKNEFTDELEAYKTRLLKRKKNVFFDDQTDLGYFIGEEDGQRFPVSRGRVCPSCHSAMLSGAFAACGRAGENADGYRIEIPVPNERTLKTVTDGLEEIGITVKTACRRGELLIYLRKRALVEDLLAYIGAQGVSLRISADEAERSVRVVANRQKNCDTTNILRTLSASERQVAAIKAIEENGALDKLPQNLKETAVLRLENPIASLDEITELHGGALSRSGVNHRLAKIIEFAEKNGYIVK